MGSMMRKFRRRADLQVAYAKGLVCCKVPMKLIKQDERWEFYACKRCGKQLQKSRK